jgi:glycosyltransferase involved in cell wall biosynthesis
VAPFAPPVLMTLDAQSAGGAEVQQVLVGRELARRGWSVSFVVADYGQGTVKQADGVRVISTFPVHGRRGALGVVQRGLALGHGMRAAEADVYVTRSGMLYTLPIVWACRRLRKPFVYLAAHDRNFDPRLQSEIPWVVRAGFRISIKVARAVVVQSERQRALLEKYFSRQGVLIRSGYPLPEVGQYGDGEYILWVGSTSKWKRPEFFLELARRVPHLPCVMVVAPAGARRRFAELEEAARDLPNLDFRGFVPFAMIDEVVSKARMLVATSSAEGFPNVFVQAWAHGVPTLSLGVDPDEVICRFGVGRHVSNMEELVDSVTMLWSDDVSRGGLARTARHHAEADHDIHKVVDAYACLLSEVQERQSRPK